MRRVILTVLILATSLIMATGFLWVNRVRAMNVNINVRDLKEYGLSIISPADPSFDGKVSALLKNHPGLAIESIKPFSVFVKNSGNRAVAGYDLKWELTDRDG